MVGGRRTALIIAPSDDVHAQVVAWEVARLGGKAVILDTADFPDRWHMSMRFDGREGAGFAITTAEGLEMDADSVSGVWMRRRQIPSAPLDVPDAKHRDFCRSEARALLDGWLYALSPLAINPLKVEFACRRKPYQLGMAIASGLKVPRTLITNDAAAARAFAAACASGQVYKILTNTPWQLTPTRTLGAEELENLDLLRFAPVIFQERIDGGPDIRVTIVDDHVFPAEITSHRPEAAVDWRLDLSVEMRRCTMPDTIVERLLDFHRRCGLRFGAYDLRRDAAGDHYFLEVNPGGQFLFVEIHTGLPISRAIAGSLLGRRSSVAR